MGGELPERMIDDIDAIISAPSNNPMPSQEWYIDRFDTVHRMTRNQSTAIFIKFLEELGLDSTNSIMNYEPYFLSKLTLTYPQVLSAAQDFYLSNVYTLLGTNDLPYVYKNWDYLFGLKSSLGEHVVQPFPITVK